MAPSNQMRSSRPEVSPVLDLFLFISFGFFTVAFVTFIILGIVTIIDSKEIPIQVHSMKVSLFNVSSGGTTNTTTTTATASWEWDVGFLYTNPTKMKDELYNGTIIYVMYKTQLLGGGFCKPFEVYNRSKTLVQPSAAAYEEQLEDWAAKTMVEDLRRDGYLDFYIEIVTREISTHKIWGIAKEWRSHHCPNVRVGFSSNNVTLKGTLLGESKPCKEINLGSESDRQD